METNILFTVQDLRFRDAGAYLAKIVENQTENIMDNKMEAGLM